MKHAFTIGAFAILTDAEQRVLLCLRHDYDIWNLPGGGVERGEAPWDAVVREVKEETGLTVAVERIVGIYSKPEQDDLVFSYKCNVVSGDIQLSAEAKDIRYFSVQELPRNIVQKQVERIQDYFAKGDGVAMVKQ